MTKIEANILENYNYYQCFARMSNESQDVVRDKWLNSTRTLKSCLGLLPKLYVVYYGFKFHYDELTPEEVKNHSPNIPNYLLP